MFCLFVPFSNVWKLLRPQINSFEGRGWISKMGVSFKTVEFGETYSKQRFLEWKGPSPNFTLILSEFKRVIDNFYSPWNHQRTVDFAMIQGEYKLLNLTELAQHSL